MFLVSCESQVRSRGGIGDGNLDIEEITISNSRSFRVAVLLPLSGNAEKYGNGLKNAAMLALDDLKNHNVILQFYDTKSSPEGARVAIENAINQKSELIIGPLMSSEVKAIKERAYDKRIPVITFSTSEEVLGDGVYTMGLLIDEQIDRIMTYATNQGRRNFALVLPDNAGGHAVERAAVKSADKNMVSIVKIAFYPPDTADFSGFLKDTAKDALFDVVIVPESGYRLKSILAMFGYHDIYSPKVKFLGTSVWEGTNLNNETAAYGAWYPAMSKGYSTYFGNKYFETFGEKPNALYSLAYDAVALSVELSRRPVYELETEITKPEGYYGINGYFRLFKNGTNQHSLDIFEVRQSGDIAIDTIFRDDAF